MRISNLQIKHSAVLNLRMQNRFKGHIEWWDRKEKKLNDDITKVDKENVEAALLHTKDIIV